MPASLDERASSPSLDTASRFSEKAFERRSSRKRPKRSLLAVIAAHPRYESFVGFVFSEIADVCRQARAFQQMTRSVLVSAASGVIEREFDHGAERQRRRRRVLAGQRLGDWRQDLIAISVEVLRSLHNELRRAIERGPRRQEPHGMEKILVAFGEFERSRLRVHGVEIGQPFQMLSQMLIRQKSLEA